MQMIWWQALRRAQHTVHPKVQQQLSPPILLQWASISAA